MTNRNFAPDPKPVPGGCLWIIAVCIALWTVAAVALWAAIEGVRGLLA